MKTTKNRKTFLHRLEWLVLFAILATIVVSLPAKTALAENPIPDFPPPGPLPPTEETAPTLTRPFKFSADDFAYPTYLPITFRALSDSQVNTQNRDESLEFYLTNYADQTSEPIGWTGNYSSCAPGTTSSEFRAAVLRRINYFRLMAGIPPVSFSDESNRLAQAAAFLMSVNDDLNHTPPPTWQCYTADAYKGASSSNLAMGAYGWNAITLYMRDWSGGSNNAALGHRRWILYPRTKVMGTGDIPAGGHPATNALRVFGDLTWDERPATRDAFVAWPPPGFVPRPVVFAAWSISYPGADFSAATVTMTSSGANVPLSILPITNGYGENTLAWAPTLSSSGSDVAYQVSIQNILIDGQVRNFGYSVTLFTP